MTDKMLLVMDKSSRNVELNMYNIFDYGKLVELNSENLLSNIGAYELFIVVDIIEVRPDLKVPILNSLDSYYNSLKLNILINLSFTFPSRNAELSELIRLCLEFEHIEIKQRSTCVYTRTPLLHTKLEVVYGSRQSHATDFFYKMYILYDYLVNKTDYITILNYMVDNKYITDKEKTICLLDIDIQEVMQKWIR